MSTPTQERDAELLTEFLQILQSEPYCQREPSLRNFKQIHGINDIRDLLVRLPKEFKVCLD